MNGSDAVQYTKAVDGPPEDAITVPLKSLSLPEIQERSEFWLNDALEIHTAGDLWVFLKQVEAFVDSAKDKLKEAAYGSLAEAMGGSVKGTVLGHEVKLTAPSRWVYSDEVRKLEAQQKLDLKALKAAEEAEGTAQKTSPTPTITVTLRK